jgi:class 3 adenylate cyclase
LAGLQWDWTDAERDAVHDLIVFLEARRVLTVPYQLELMDEVVTSVREIRDVLTETLQRLSEAAKSRVLVNEMREAAVQFLIVAGRSPYMNAREALLLGELRGLFVQNVRVLADKFGFEVQGALGDALSDSARPDP